MSKWILIALCASCSTPSSDTIVPPSTPSDVAQTAQAAAESSMIASSIAALITEVAANDLAGADLGLTAVPQGNVREIASDLGLDMASECGAAGGTETLDRCPAVIQCRNRTVLAYGRGCSTPSGRRISGTIRVITPDQAPTRWELGDAVIPLALESDGGRILVQGSLDMVKNGARLVFNQRTEGLRVRMPRVNDRRDGSARPFRVKLEDISLEQTSDGLRVSGPDTFVLEDVPVDCEGMTTMIDLTVEDCGGWKWTTPLTACLCPIAGSLRVIGPLLDPCGAPTSIQTMVVDFKEITASVACGANLGAVMYSPSTQCASSCGACDPGRCRAGVCSNSVDVSALASTMVGWICELPATSCATAADAGVTCPAGDGGALDRDASARDADSLDSGRDLRRDR